MKRFARSFCTTTPATKPHKFVNHYRILEVPYRTTQHTIKVAYHKRLREYESTTGALSDEARFEQEFQDITNAYEVLSDTFSRGRYNQEWGEHLIDDIVNSKNPNKNDVLYFQRCLKDYSDDFQQPLQLKPRLQGRHRQQRWKIVCLLALPAIAVVFRILYNEEDVVDRGDAEVKQLVKQEDIVFILPEKKEKVDTYLTILHHSQMQREQRGLPPLKIQPQVEYRMKKLFKEHYFPNYSNNEVERIDDAMNKNATDRSNDAKFAEALRALDE